MHREAGTGNAGAGSAAPPVPTQGEDLSAVVNSIGPKVRRLRKQWNLSLQQLADRSNVSTAAIHKVEQGAMVPTITTLLKLAAALEQPVSYFVEEDQEPPLYAVFTPAAERRSIYTPHEGLTLGGISGPYGHYFVATAIAEVEPGADSGETSLRHAGEELIHMLSGRLDVDVGDQSFQLRRGDSIHFRTEQEHRWHNPYRHTARAVWTALRPT